MIPRAHFFFLLYYFLRGIFLPSSRAAHVPLRAAPAWKTDARDSRAALRVLGLAAHAAVLGIVAADLGVVVAAHIAAAGVLAGAAAGAAVDDGKRDKLRCKYDG